MSYDATTRTHSLVPLRSFGFGENDIYETFKDNSLLRQIQLRCKELLGFSVPVFYGRSVFTYNMGLLPFRRPLTVVVADRTGVSRQVGRKGTEIGKRSSECPQKHHALFKAPLMMGSDTPGSPTTGSPTPEVVGDAIRVEKTAHPSHEQIEALKAR